MSAGHGKSGLSKQELKGFKEILLAQKKQLEGALHRSEVSGRDQHGDAGDHGNSEQLVALTVREQSRKREELGMVMGALERIEKDTYGQCQSHDCEGNGQIDAARLRAIPTATFCIGCMSEREDRLKKK
jgi:DnaK suppressor protein